MITRRYLPSPISSHALRFIIFSLPALSYCNNLPSFFAGADLNYLTSNIELKLKDSAQPPLQEKKYFAVSGFGQGIHAGYRHAFNDRFYLGLSLAYTNIEAESTELRTQSGTEKFKLYVKMNHLFYPSLDFGYSPSKDTLIIAKAGFGNENWSSTLKPDAATPTISLKDHSATGTVIGAEVLTAIHEKFLMALSVTHSVIDSFNSGNTATGGTCTLCLAPETLSVSARIQYHPKRNELSSIDTDE